MDYVTLTDDDKLAIAKDRLRGLESDHYRLSITPSAPDANEARLADYEQQISDVKDEVQRVQAVVDDQHAEREPTPSRPDPAPDDG